MLDVETIVTRRAALINRLRDLEDIRAAIKVRADAGTSFPGESARDAWLAEEAVVLNSELVGADRQLAAWGIEVRQ